MKTVINEHGCTTHPHGSPSLEVTVPLTVQGVNILEELQAINARLDQFLTAKLIEAVAAEQPKPQTATPEPLEAPVVTPEPPVEQSAVEEVSAPAKATTGKKSAKAAE
jgi:hypothetical protein